MEIRDTDGHQHTVHDLKLMYNSNEIGRRNMISYLNDYHNGINEILDDVCSSDEQLLKIKVLNDTLHGFYKHRCEEQTEMKV